MELSVDAGRMTRGVRRAVWLGSLLLGVVPGVAEGQEASRLRVAVQARRAGEATLADFAPVQTVVVRDSTRGHPILRGAGIGFLAGAGVGLVSGLVLNANSRCNLPEGIPCSHSEDGLALIVLPMYGAFFGTIAGGVIGAIVR